ncbi:MAG: hypothetical protein JO334_08085 [Verrucomicrobia bacterium]|nr:hypothetical protein [Verrucomicrobiota bacterium]
MKICPLICCRSHLLAKSCKAADLRFKARELALASLNILGRHHSIAISSALLRLGNLLKGRRESDSQSAFFEHHQRPATLMQAALNAPGIPVWAAYGTTAGRFAVPSARYLTLTLLLCLYFAGNFENL